MPEGNSSERGSASGGALSVRYEQVTKRYPGSDSPAVEDLTLDIPAGDICVLVGPSGCGKTTAMRMANRMVEMDSGDILLGAGRRPPPAQLRREMGYVIQQVGLFPHRTNAQNIATVPILLGWDRHRIDARVRELLELVGLTRRWASATRRSSRAASSSASGWRGRSRPTRP